MEDFIYYFYNYKVETATVEINLPGWQKLTDDEIEIYKSGNYNSIEIFDERYTFTKITNANAFDLEQYKRIKIEYISGESFTRAEQAVPEYRYKNCLISKSLIERGKGPIYNNYLEIIQQYEDSRISCRNEFYRCKNLIEHAKTKEEVDNINFEYETKS